jgi:hypothetical protein
MLKPPNRQKLEPGLHRSFEFLVQQPALHIQILSTRFAPHSSAGKVEDDLGPNVLPIFVKHLKN